MASRKYFTAIEFYSEPCFTAGMETKKQTAKLVRELIDRLSVQAVADQAQVTTRCVYYWYANGRMPKWHWQHLADL